jgi:hypothetical protein
MRPALLALSTIAFITTTNAQTLSIQPQVGFDQTRTAIGINNIHTVNFNNLSPYAGLRLDVATKKGHGAFAAVSTNRSAAEYSFADPEGAATKYTVETGGFRLNIMGGYQFNSKKILLGKPGTNASKRIITEHYSPSYRSHCGAYSNRCGSRLIEKFQASRQSPRWYMSVQPSIGAAFATSQKSPTQSLQADGTTNYTYSAANWRTAIVSGIAFEFGKNNSPEFTVGVNYLRGVGKFGKESIASTDQLKNSVANFTSNASAWNVNIGLPLNLLKKKEVAKEKPASKCLYYKSKCQRYRVI